MGGAHQTVNRHSRIIELHPLPLPLGEVAERSEDGEGKTGFNTLSVTFGDSSPRGRAKGCTRIFTRKMERIVTDTLHSLFCDHPSKCRGKPVAIRTGITAG